MSSVIVAAHHASYTWLSKIGAVQSCQTTFLQQAQQTPGLDFLVQAIQRGNLVLPAAGSGVTSFAPNNAAFTDMLQTLSAVSSPT